MNRVQLPLAKYTDEELRRAREILAQPGANATFLERVKANRIVDVAAAEGQYEVISTRYAEGSGEILVTAAIGLLGELHKQAIEQEKRL